MTNTLPSRPGHGTIETLFRHNLWANSALFEFCARLTDEQLDTAIDGTFGSIRNTLQHIANSEYAYWYRVTTGQPYRRPEGAGARSLAELLESIRASGEGLIGVAPTVHAQDSVVVDWDGTPRSVPHAIFLTQAINHATEHRAQIMTTLTQLGIEPPGLDSWSFFDATTDQ